MFSPISHTQRKRFLMTWIQRGIRLLDIEHLNRCFEHEAIITAHVLIVAAIFGYDFTMCVNWESSGDPQVKIVIFTAAKSLIEPSHVLQNALWIQDSRLHTDQIPLEKSGIKVAVFGRLIGSRNDRSMSIHFMITA